MYRMYGNRGCGPRGGSRRWGPFEFRWEVDPEMFASVKSGGGRRRMFDGGELRLVLLKLIEESPRHGYDLIREIEERTGGAYAPSPGVVYPTITLLDDMGLIEEQQAEGAKKVFAITEAGKSHLEERADEVEALMRRLSEVGEMRQRHRGGPVRRAMHNLRAVIAQKVASGEIEADTLHDIAEIIDEAARKIERM